MTLLQKFTPHFKILDPPLGPIKVSRYQATRLLPKCNFTSGQPNFFRALFSAPVSRRFKSPVIFYFAAINAGKTFCLHFYWLIFCSMVTTCESCFYFWNLIVLLENPRTDVNRKPQRWLHVDEEISKSWQDNIYSVRLGIEISKMRRHKLKLVSRYHLLQTSTNSMSAAFLATPKLPDVFCDKTVRPCEPVSVNYPSEPEKLRPLFRYNTNKRSYRGH